MYSTHDEGKGFVAKRLIRTLKNKIYKYMTSISKNVYIDKLDDIANEYNNTYSTNKMKSLDVKSMTYINFCVEDSDKDTKFKVDDNVKISKYQNILAKGYTPWSEDLNGDKFLERFTTKNCKRQIEKS